MKYYLEGNVGCGKTTIATDLSKILFRTKCMIYLEGVSNWLKTVDSEGLNVLKSYYKDKTGFQMQIHAGITKSQRFDNNVQNMDIIAERSIHTDYNCFAPICYYKDKTMTELEYIVYKNFYNYLCSCDKSPYKIIYIRTSPEKCYERIIKRGRKEEIDSLTIERLRDIHNYHDEWLIDNPRCVVINGDIDLVDSRNYKKNVTEKILSFI